MLLQEHDQDAFKRWVLPKLETISDADAEVLADYVSALVVAQDSEANVKRNCVASLSDFLQDNTEAFVSDVIKALKDKSYVAPATLPPGASSTAPSGAPKGPAATTSSKKRKLVDREANQAIEVHAPPSHRNVGNKRPAKQTARRGGTNARGRARESLDGYANPTTMLNFPNFPEFPDFPNFPNFPNFPPPPPGPLPFDPSDPMAMVAMAAAFKVDLSGMLPAPFATPQNNGQSLASSNVQCQDYHVKGFCVLGAVCPYEHGNAIAVSANEIPQYDPEHASLAMQKPRSGINGRGAPRRKVNNNKGGQTRAPFAHLGPSQDPSNTVLVVDKIPDEHFSDDKIRAFFSTFGDIVDVQMHTYKRLAIIKFQDHEAAERAYNSPKAVFDNRFVRVFWHKSDSLMDASLENMEMSHNGQEDEREDPQVIAKRQAEAQIAFEERRRRAEETAARSAEIDRLLQEKTKEMHEIRRLLAELSGDKSGEEEGFAQTLAELQAEAEDLFAQYEPEASPPSRGRGAFRGGSGARGYRSFPPRGNGHAAFRGARRGRGANFAAFPGRTGVRRLDNRPRRLAVADVQEHSAKDEALRQYLINVPDCTRIEPHPEQADALLLTFNERYQAEMFLDASRSIADVGKLDFSWVPNDAFGGLTTAAAAAGGHADEAGGASDDGESSSAMIEQDEVKTEGGVKVEDEDEDDADMDVADDVDQWL